MKKKLLVTEFPTDRKGLMVVLSKRHSAHVTAADHVLMLIMGSTCLAGSASWLLLQRQ